MALSDQLTVLLAGFDLTYRVLPESRAIDVAPVRWESLSPAATTRPVARSRRGATSGKQLFTLRIENQPVGKVLEQLSRRLGWELEIDESAIRAAGRSLDTLVSFNVENADADQLLDALLAPAGLAAGRDGNRLRVAPR